MAEGKANMARRKKTSKSSNTNNNGLEVAILAAFNCNVPAPQAPVEEEIGEGLEGLNLEAILQEGEEELEKLLLQAEEETAAALYARLKEVRKAGGLAAMLMGQCPVKLEVECSRIRGRLKELEEEKEALKEKRRLRESELAALVARLKKGERAALVPAQAKQAVVIQLGRQLDDLEGAILATHRLLEAAVVKLEKRRGAPAAVKAFAVEEGRLQATLLDMVIEGVKTGGRLAPTLGRIREEARAWATRK